MSHLQFLEVEEAENVSLIHFSSSSLESGKFMAAKALSIEAQLHIRLWRSMGGPTSYQSLWDDFEHKQMLQPSWWWIPYMFLPKTVTISAWKKAYRWHGFGAEKLVFRVCLASFLRCVFGRAIFHLSWFFVVRVWKLVLRVLFFIVRVVFLVVLFPKSPKLIKMIEHKVKTIGQ